MKSERKANDYLSQTAEAFQAERALWAKKLSPPAKVVRPVAKPVNSGFFGFFFKLA